MKSLLIFFALLATTIADHPAILVQYPDINVRDIGGDQVEITFSSGVLQESTDGMQTWQDVTPQPASPYVTTRTLPTRFWRVLDTPTPDDQYVIMGYHGGQSNGGGEGDMNLYPVLQTSTALVNYQFGQQVIGQTYYEPTTNVFGEYGAIGLANPSTHPYTSVGADKWYGEAMSRGFNLSFAIANFAQGGTPTSYFIPPTTGNNGGRYSPLVNATLENTKAELEAANPHQQVLFQFAYWDQVEFDGGNGSSFDITKAQFETQRNTRAILISRLYDALSGKAQDPARRFSVTNPDIVLFVRDIGDGQWKIGGGGVALNADISDPDYIIKADPTRTFNGVTTGGLHIPYNSNVVGDTYYSGTAEWNGWMAIRSAHQLLTDSSHGSPYYRPNIVLVDSDGIGTRGNTAKSGDGVHWGAVSQRLVADRFLTEYNTHFGTSLTIAP